MSVDKEKKFVIKHVYENLKTVPSHETVHGNAEKHFGATWRPLLYKYDDGTVNPYLFCDGAVVGNWSINTICQVFVNGIPFDTGMPFEFSPKLWSFLYRGIPENEIPNYGIDKSVTIEYHVKIDKMIGSFRRFDDDVAKESSDVVLMVGNLKFYVYKTFLSFHSTYFKSLFSGKFEESEKSEIELKDIDAGEFYTFVGFIYGFLAVEDSNVSKMLKLADFFDAQIVVERCEQFLMTVSKNDFVEKFQLSLKYKMDNLKSKCLSEMNENSDFVGLAPENPEECSGETWKKLYLKAVNCLKF
ncbi:unnamed protein product [Caenorhabditis nigoni]